MQLITTVLISLLICFVRCDTKSVEDSSIALGKNDVSVPQTWRGVIGDICQLPSIPRPTANPDNYIECVHQPDNAGNRTDLGIWVLKECPDGYQFVASARECRTVDSIKAQQELCNGPDASKYPFCTAPNNSLRFMVKKLEQSLEKCVCPEGQKECECPKVEIIELIPYNGALGYNSNASKVRQARQIICQGQQGCFNGVISNGNCACQSSSCICPTADPPSVTQDPHQQIPSGCQMTSDGQIYCPQVTTPQPTVIEAQPCPLVAGQSTQNAQYQGICSWMIDPLVADPQSTSHFLQCQPTSNSLYCGRWQRMPCEPGLIFNAQLQVCVWDPSTQPGRLPSATQTPGVIPYQQITQPPYGTTLYSYPVTPIPVVQRPHDSTGQCGCDDGAQIGTCGTNNQCPGQSVCQNGNNQITGRRACAACCYKQ